MIHIEELSDAAKKEAYLESKILEQLDHPNIIKFREVFLTKAPEMTLHLVMDFADGGDLQAKISRQIKCFSETQILDWFTQICLAIKHIHDRKILHRDLKSQNIFLTKNGLIKLGDFGVAKCLSYTLEQVQTITGTPYYLSPEIVLNKPYSFKSDIWSLGVLLYEMCALKMPFNAQSLPKLSLNIIKGTYNPLPINYSKDLKTLIALMLQVDPYKRPSIYEVLSLNIVKNRAKAFLSELQYSKEFSHTILHQFNVLNIGPKKNVKINNSNSTNNILIKNNLNNLKKISNSNSNSNSDSKPSSNISNENNSESKNKIVQVNRAFSDKKSDSIQAKPKDLNDIKNALAKHKKNINPGNIVRNTSSVDFFAHNSINSNSINSQQHHQLELREFIETMHNKIDQKEDLKEDLGKVIPDKNEIKDLVNTHKMLLELANIQNIQNINTEDSNKIVTTNDIEIDLNLDNINLSLSDEFKSTHFASDTIKSEDIELNFNSEADDNSKKYANAKEVAKENSELEIMKEELEKELGVNLLSDLYKIVIANTPENVLKMDYDEIVSAIELDFKSKYGSSEVTKAIDTIYEIWSLVVKERQEKFSSKE